MFTVPQVGVAVLKTLAEDHAALRLLYVAQSVLIKI